MPRRIRLLTSAVVAALLSAAAPVVAVSPPAAVPTVAQEVIIDAPAPGQHTVALPLAASHVALHWPGAEDAAVSVALGDGVGGFGEPVRVQLDEVGEQLGDGETYGAVMVARGATALRITTDRALPRLSALAMNSLRPGSLAGGAGFGFGATAAATVAQPMVLARADWGANEAYRFDRNGNEIWPRDFHPIQKLIVHHTATDNDDPDPEATIRSIYYYHAVRQGWGDIGYNFLIDEAGNVYEGRFSREYAAGESPTGEDLTGRGVTAGHAKNFNAGTVGVALLGTLTDIDAKQDARSALELFLAWKADRDGIDPQGASHYVNPVNGTEKTFPNIAGHRDVNATECPGSRFYVSFPALRSAVASIIGPDTTAPLAPTGLDARPRETGVALNWADNSARDLARYWVYRQSGDEPWTAVASTSASEFVDGGLKVGVVYAYRVTAFDDASPANESSPSNEASAAAAVPTQPGPPVLSAAPPSRGKGVVLSWTIPEDGLSAITNYRIYRRTGSSGAEVFLAEVGNVTTYHDTATKRSTAYTYRVSAVNGVGEGPMSNEATAIAK